MPVTMKVIGAVIAKEFKSDFKNPYLLGGVGLFLVSTIFVSFLAFRKIASPAVWVALFWIIFLFAAFNAVAKVFQNESKGKALYWHSLVSPTEFILARMLYHALLLNCMAFLALVVFMLVNPIEIGSPWLFVLALLLGSCAFAFSLSLLSSIAGKAGRNMTMLSILSLPVLLPVLGTLVLLSKHAIDGLTWATEWKYVTVLGGLSIVSFLMSLVLFPYLWRE